MGRVAAASIVLLTSPVVGVIVYVFLPGSSSRLAEPSERMEHPNPVETPDRTDSETPRAIVRARTDLRVPGPGGWLRKQAKKHGFKLIILATSLVSIAAGSRLPEKGLLGIASKVLVEFGAACAVAL